MEEHLGWWKVPDSAWYVKRFKEAGEQREQFI